MRKYNLYRHTNKKKYVKISKGILPDKQKEYRPKAPLIRSFGFISGGIILIVLLIWVLILPSYDEISDFFGALGFVIFLGGLGFLYIVVGLKMRRW